MLEDDVIQAILHRVMVEQAAKARPAPRHFFEHRPPSEGQQRTITIHKWVVSKIFDTDTIETVRYLASTAVKEVLGASSKITGEIIFRSSHLLPGLPLWEDGLPLFDERGSDRFGLPGGNVQHCSGSDVDDVRNAAQRLQQMDEEYDGDERLQLFCARPQAKALTKAAAKASVPCRVFALSGYPQERSWVLTRDVSPCSLLIGKPSFSLPVKGNQLVVGARFVVWIDDPRYAVCVIPQES